VKLTTKPALGIVLLLFAPLAVAQSKLGELLDAGGKKLSGEDFKEEVVQRVLIGPTAAGGSIEVLYAQTGVIQGLGTYSPTTQRMAPVAGVWTIDESGRVCTSMQIGGGIGGAAGSVSLPPRCQSWFKYKDQYFLADSDTDRQARVLVRTLKQ
jgi:hypothetical protein